MNHQQSSSQLRDLEPQAAGRKLPARVAYLSALQAIAAGDREAAAESYRNCIDLDPGYAEAHHDLGVLAAERGDIEATLKFFDRALGLKPDYAEAYANLCLILTRVGRVEEAIAMGRKAVALRPDSAEAHAKLGAALRDAGTLDDAAQAYVTAATLDPRYVEAHLVLAEIYRETERTDLALVSCQKALELDPRRPETLNTLGNIYQQLGLTRPSFDAYHAAVTLKPDYGQAYANLSVILRQIGQVEAAVSMASLAARLMPQAFEVHINHAGALRQSGKPVEAIEAYRQAIALKPDLHEISMELCNVRQNICDWAGLKEEQAAAMALCYGSGKRPAPFSVLIATSSPADHLRCARAWAQGLKAPRPPLAAYDRKPEERDRQRLRIGYVSADYYRHATASLIAELFELHDRSRFELLGYSIGHDDGSEIRRRLLNGFDKFSDLRSASNEEAARLIHHDELDVLIDLKGYTEGARPEILAARPAPIQVNYLGYPGTMGASFIDYIIADAFIAPFDQAPFFDEKIVHLPHCYQPNDSQRQIAAHQPSRGECGLPENGIVFCSFNNTYKITPEVFDVWMRLLHSIAGSVLWLLEANQEVVGNLRREALARGVDPQRLVFAPRIDAAAHISRMRVADLFLDTLPVNAHTTASEALWAGLPVLTCAGETFVSRVAGSLLTTVGLPELITTSLADYEARAFELAREPARLAKLRARLNHNRATSPLFASARYTRNYEAALLRMVELRDVGRPPEAFAISDP